MYERMKKHGNSEKEKNIAFVFRQIYLWQNEEIDLGKITESFPFP